MASNSLCSVQDCCKPKKARGFCWSHYWRYRKYGSPHLGGTQKNTGIRFVEDIALPFDGDECLLWPISLNADGYGQICIENKRLLASRYVCERAHGSPAPQELHAAHSCGNQSCVNPKHLRWATPLENNADKLVHDTHNKGQRHGLAKLTESDVLAIRALAGIKSQSQIAHEFGISQTNVGFILRRQRWTHI